MSYSRYPIDSLSSPLRRSGYPAPSAASFTYPAGEMISGAQSRKEVWFAIHTSLNRASRELARGLVRTCRG